MHFARQQYKICIDIFISNHTIKAKSGFFNLQKKSPENYQQGILRL